MRAFIPCLVALLAVVAAPALADEPHRFEFRDGDRIVLVGDTLIERDQRYGYLETLLTALHPDRNLTFRNLGWSGDTVAGLSRAGFDPPEVGYRQLIEQVKAAKPTVLTVGYGMADSFDGEAGLSRFVEGLNRFLDATAKSGARVVLLSPIAHAPRTASLPDPSAHNAALQQYAQAIEEVAKARGAWFIDLFGPSRERERQSTITDDGIHLVEDGYKDLAGWIARGLDPAWSGEQPRVAIGAKDSVFVRAHVDDFERSDKGIHFTLKPMPLMTAIDRPPGISISVAGLPSGRHELRVDGHPVATETAEEWARGVDVVIAPDRVKVEKLREAINRKNRLFFHRWRPQNITYLFGFRKHEQGNNAVEIPQFDPLVAEQETRIAALRKPAAHRFELAPATGR